MAHRIANWQRYRFKVPHHRTDAALDAEHERRKAAATLPAELNEFAPERLQGAPA